MNLNTTLKRAEILISLLFIFNINLLADLNNSFFLQNNFLKSEKLIVKINEIASEVKLKTGVSIYLAIVETLNGKDIHEYQNELISDLNSSYILLTFAKQEQKVDIISSDDISSKIDKDTILDEYMIPILVARNKEGNLENQYYAAIFNGFAEIADEVATSFNIQLTTNIGSEGKATINILNAIFWFMIFSFVATFVYIRIKR
ncbi:MAG: TPM domain-containing protein [Campylobacterales bacterium]|nr:TPM domain-containing protein [Campylobacterales bacterium]